MNTESERLKAVLATHCIPHATIVRQTLDSPQLQEICKIIMCYLLKRIEYQCVEESKVDGSGCILVNYKKSIYDGTLFNMLH